MKLLPTKLVFGRTLSVISLFFFSISTAVAQNGSSLPADISKLRTAVEKEPSNFDRHKAFTDALRGDGETEMDRQYAIWMKKFPKLAMVPFGIGSAYERRESPKAKPYLMKAVSLDPKFAEGWEALSSDAERQGEFAESREFREKAIAADPGNVDYLFYYAASFSGTDKPRYVQLSLDLIRDHPKDQRAAQALYWLAVRSEDPAEKMKFWERLYNEYPAAEYNWSASGMDEYFTALLSVDPGKAEKLATEMAEGKDDAEAWKRNKKLAEKISVAKKLLAEKKGKEARQVLGEITLSKYSSFGPELVLLKAYADDQAGNTLAAYDSVMYSYVKTPKARLKVAVNEYGKKVGKSSEEIEADFWKQIDGIAKPATPFSLMNYYTKATTSLEDYKGKVVLLTYWFPGCGPCRGEFPYFENVIRKFKGQDLEYVGINIVSKQNDYVLPFLKASKYSFTPLEDVKGRDKGTLDNRGLAPVNFLIDKEGRVIFSFFRTDSNNEDELETMIKLLLEGKG